MRYVRSPNIVAFWDSAGFLVEEFALGLRVRSSPLILQLLDVFSSPHELREACQLLPQYGRDSVLRELRNLRRLGFLVATKSRPVDIPAKWHGCLAAAYYHFAVKDVSYLLRRSERLAFVKARFALSPQPELYKTYPGRPRIPIARWRPGDHRLNEILFRRRTTRTFSRSPVPLAKFGPLIAGTWGQTGWVDGGMLGKLVAKTSPSAGARNPTECYVIAWRVESLRPGLYHFNVRSNALERLKSGDLRREAAAIASGIPWIRNAAFLCVMTAVVDRVLWKYPHSKSYSVFYLDAGHLAQTFLLLATAHGLGGFTTAAIQHSRAESLLGLDGIGEFPIYLCGAGVPVRPAAGARRSRVTPQRAPLAWDG